ncbi:MAG: NAD-dependent epimerase/dehydratase family protein, partial [bacterium]|nr:NAD-dependent epimerase/dehydratase family protein [bacterium]
MSCTETYRLLVTGGAGFIGVNLLNHLLKSKKYKISILDNLSSGNFVLLEEIAHSNNTDVEHTFSTNPGRLYFKKGDIRDKAVVEEIVGNQDGIVHLAAQAGVMPSIANPREDADINIMGTLNLLEASGKHHLKRFIMASSAAPLGEQEPPLEETTVPAPLSPYGASKLAAEGYCSAFYGSFGVPATVLRFSNVYGPNSFHKGSVVALFIKRIFAGETLDIYGDGQQTRDYLYVEDIAHTIAEILAAHPKNIAGQVFQLGTEVETSVNRLIELMENLAPGKLDICHKPVRKGEIVRNYTSTRKLRECLQLPPPTSLETGLKNTWKWFES